MTHPVLGSIVSRKLGDESNDLPNFISVGSPKFNGYGGGHLGPKFGPIRVEETGELSDLQPVGSLADFDAKASLLDELNTAFLTDHASPSVQARR